MNKKKSLLFLTTFLFSITSIPVSGAPTTLSTNSITEKVPGFSNDSFTNAPSEYSILKDNYRHQETSISISSELYKLFENKIFKIALPQSLDLYQEYISLYSEQKEMVNLQSVSFEMTPASRAILRFALPFDISWLDTFDIYTLSGLTNGVETTIKDYHANDSKIFTSELYFDIKSQTEYTRIPEISSDYLKTDYIALYSAYGYNYSVTESEKNTNTNLWPDTTSLESILSNYYSIFIDDFKLTSQSIEKLSVDGVDTMCHTYTGELTQEETQNMFFEFLRTLRDDTQLKPFFDAYYGIEADSEYYYEYFKEYIDYIIEELHSGDTLNVDFSLASKIWLTAENQLVGRQLSIIKENEYFPVFTTFAVPDGNTCGILWEIGNPEYGGSYGLSGVLERLDEKLNGTLRFLINKAPLCSLTITDFLYNPNFQPDSELGGHLSLEMHSGSKDVPLYNTLANFDILADLSGTIENNLIKLSINSAKVPLVNVIIQTTPAEADMFPALPDFSNALDSLSNADMFTYTQEADWSTLIKNCELADIPSEIIKQISYYMEEYVFYGQSIL